MLLITESQLKYEIAHVDRLIGQLEAVHQRARALSDDDLKGTVTDSIANVIQTLRDRHSKMQQQLGSILFGTECFSEDDLEGWLTSQALPDR
jgi:hypothetical protein